MDIRTTTMGEFDIYVGHIENYLRRALTYEEDIPNAFRAIMEDHTAYFSTKFCWGLVDLVSITTISGLDQGKCLTHFVSLMRL